MKRKARIVQLLIASSGVIFGVSAHSKEWKLSIPATVLLMIAVGYAIFGKSRDTSERKLEELLKKGEETRT